MNDLDYGRKMDLEQIAEGIKNARSQAEVRQLEHLMHQIINQSTTVTSLRNELIAATVAGDTNKIKRLQMHLQAIRLSETHGRSWGNTKGEKNG